MSRSALSFCSGTNGTRAISRPAGSKSVEVTYRRERRPLAVSDCFTQSAWNRVMSAGAIRSPSLSAMTSDPANAAGETASADGPLPRMKIVSVPYVDAISAIRVEK